MVLQKGRLVVHRCARSTGGINLRKAFGTKAQVPSRIKTTALVLLFRPTRMGSSSSLMMLPSRSDQQGIHIRSFGSRSARVLQPARPIAVACCSLQCSVRCTTGNPSLLVSYDHILCQLPIVTNDLGIWIVKSHSYAISTEHDATSHLKTFTIPSLP